jgi:hypothetical protein
VVSRPAVAAADVGPLRGAPLLAGLFVFFPALALYARTLMPDVGTWDTAEFQTVGIVLGIAHPTGYPTYTLLGWLASVVLQPFGEPALRANLLSAILAATGSGLAAAIVTFLTRRAVVGIAAGVALAVSPAAWGVGARADAHALHLALVALLLLLLVAWTERERTGRRADGLLLAAAVVFGVSLGNHALTLLLAPGIALLLLTTVPRLPIDRSRLVVACAAALVLTTIALYAYLPIRSAMNPPLDYANPQTWEGFTYLVFAEQFQGTFQPLPAWPEMIAMVARATLDELGPAAVAALVGIVVALVRRPQLLLMLAAWFVINWVFAIGYVNADIERYRLAPLLSVAVLAGVGVGGIIDGARHAWRRWLAARRPDGWVRSNRWRVGLALLLAVALITPSALLIPQRFDDNDMSDWHYARRWLDAVLPQFEPNAAVVSWWGLSTPLWYAQFVEGARPDIFVADDRTRLDLGLGDAHAYIEANLGRRPLYLIRLGHDLPPFHERYELTPLDAPYFGPVYRVDGHL